LTQHTTTHTHPRTYPIGSDTLDSSVGGATDLRRRAHLHGAVALVFPRSRLGELGLFLSNLRREFMQGELQKKEEKKKEIKNTDRLYTLPTRYSPTRAYPRRTTSFLGEMR